MVDYIVVGAGLTGCVLAERLSKTGKKVLIVEKKNHIGGTCFDFYNGDGILVHKYGPHIFNTENKIVWEYINQFTDFYIYHHQVLGVVEGKKVPIPFNLESLHELFPHSFAERIEKKLLEKYGMNIKVPIMELQNQDDIDLEYLARYIYDHVFCFYTQKQWGMRPEEVGGAAMARIPFYISRDNRYFQNKYQGIPKEGYTALFEKMLDNPNIHILLNTDYRDIINVNNKNNTITVLGNRYDGKVIFTAPLDELFDYCYGKLPYRTLDFKFETYNTEYYQEKATINYPNNYNFTRITEFKHMTMQKCDKTTIVKEFPHQYNDEIAGEEPYYPIPKKENEALYQKYLNKAKEIPSLILAGRLADYRYYNMSETIENALNVFDLIR